MRKSAFDQTKQAPRSVRNFCDRLALGLRNSVVRQTSLNAATQREQAMTVGHTYEHRQDTVATLPPGPEMMLGLWASCVESASKLAESQGASGRAPQGPGFWQVSPDQMAGS